MRGTLVALGIALLVVGCGSSPAPVPAAVAPPSAPSPDQDELGTIRPLPHESQKVEHDARAAELVAAGDHEACGKHYVRRLAAEPEATERDQLLFNAAACFQQAHLIGPAERARVELVSAHPRSRFVPDTLLATARNWSTIARFEAAADTYERYAASFPAREDAPDALLLALRYRLGLGDESRALENAQRFARSYGRSLPSQAAEADLLATAVYIRRGDTAGLVAHLERFERRFAATAQLGVRIAAMVARGRARWHQACPIAAIERGICARLEPTSATLVTCRIPREKLWRVVERTPALVAQAQADFRRAIESWTTARAPERTLQGSYAAAAAQFHLAEAELERTLRLTLDLRGSKKEMLERFRVFLAEYQKLQGRTVNAYREVLRHADGALYWGVAAQARMAQSHLRFVDLVLATELPEFVQQGEYAEEMQDAYCEQLETSMAPVEQQAEGRLDACSRLASAAGWHDAWTRWCQDELSRQRPATLPPMHELYPEADRMAQVPRRSRDRAVLEQQVAADPSAITARLALASLMLEDVRDGRSGAGDVAAARTHLDAVLIIAPGDTTASVLMAIALLRAEQDEETRAPLAQIVVDEARERSPDSAEAINAQGVIAAYRGQLGLAYSSFREAQLVVSDFAPAYLNAGSAALQLRKLDEAVIHFQGAVALVPSDYDAQLGLGVALRARGDLAGAERAWRAAHALASTRAEAAFNLGLLHRDFIAPAATELSASLAATKAALTWFRQASTAPAATPAQRDLAQRELEQTSRTAELLRESLQAAP